MNTWSQIAQAYHRFVDSPADKLRTELLYPHIWQALEPLSRKKLLDIGCGNGFFAYHAAQKGAQIDAFDNAAMISIAKEHFSHPAIHYRAQDGTTIFPYSDQNFDYVCANLVLMDIAELDKLLSETKRVLKQSGKVLLSILHPSFTPPVGKFRRGLLGRIHQNYAYFHLTNYFTPPAVSLKQSFGKDLPATTYYHRTLSEYAHLFHQSGLKITDILEPRPDADFIEKYPQFYHAQKISIFCVFILSK